MSRVVPILAAAANTGGAPAWQLAVLGAVYFGGTASVIWLVHSHRTGRSRLLPRAGALAELVFRLPAWSALPVTLAVAGLLLAMWSGVYDIGYHIDRGRDSGPLGNPGHLPMLLGLFLTFAGGVLAVGMADPRDATAAWVRVRPGWRAPLGGVLLTGCMAFGMAALSLDDLWHRIFGQDVTLWSPTHLIYLGGGVLTVIGMLVLLKEGAIARGRREAADGGRADSAWRWLEHAVQNVQRAVLLGGLLSGMELFLTEFDYGVPLYRQVWQPLLLAVFTGFVYVAARAWVGRGAAVAAWLSYAAVRVTGIAIPLLAGVSPSSMPLLLVPAIVVELAAVRADPRAAPIRFGAVAGLAGGATCFASEYGWSQIAMPLPWTTGLLPEGAILAVLGGLGGGLLGCLFAGALRGELPPRRVARATCIGAFALLALLSVDAAVKRVPDALAHVTLADVRPAPHREAVARVRLEPADAADGANWLYILGWQGHSPRVVDRLRRVGEGAYRSTRPIPLGGSWKVALRLNRGYERGAVVIRLPVDRGLPHRRQRLPATLTRDQLALAMRRSAGSELPAPASFTRPFMNDSLIVLRETQGRVGGWVWALGFGLIAALWASAVTALTLALGRLGRRVRLSRAAPAARGL
ncbi:MAG: hypothetical protein JOZ25_11870 [Actinobacteria bacterium]|nr:hypothetical protein [Actinomycetota bacterium]